MTSDPMLGPADPFDLAAYGYLLPEDRIAQKPAVPRDTARLLVLRRMEGSTTHAAIQDLPELLDPGDLVVVNETRVLPARLLGTLDRTSRSVEILLIRETSPGRWAAWVRPARSLRPGDTILFEGQETRARFWSRDGDTAVVTFEGDLPALLASAGHVPLPPYIHRSDDLADRDAYQTMFARVPGAIAAPTAGLHFTEDLLSRLTARGVRLVRILLHVGPGTFRPVRTADIRQHHVEAEYYRIPREAAAEIAAARARGSRICAVGTTTTRALESFHRDGAVDADGTAEGWTSLTIVPPFSFGLVTAMLTNFHLPRSSLLLLVCAFASRESVLRAYGEAVACEYRFYSYGDAMVIL
jgi:S-adenosylmethionine:tRNA ribosyltransferase-isomerase